MEISVEYLQKKPKTGAADNMNQIGQNFAKKEHDLQALMVAGTVPVSAPPEIVSQPSLSADHTPIQISQPQPEPFINLNGVVLTPNGIPLANQMVYLKQGAETVRLFKTNQAGQFQNNLPLASGDYFLEIQDPQKKHDFARMKVNSQTGNLQIFAQK